MKKNPQILEKHTDPTKFSSPVETKALYLASTEERETVGYFLADHVMGELPRNTNIPEMDFLSKGSPAQSESL